jgi:hypothetical protein
LRGGSLPRLLRRSPDETRIERVSFQEQDSQQRRSGIVLIDHRELGPNRVSRPTRCRSTHEGTGLAAGTAVSLDRRAMRSRAPADASLRVASRDRSCRWKATGIRMSSVAQGSRSIGWAFIG